MGKVVFGDIKSVKDDKKPILGSFSLINPINWYKCREQFANIFDEHTSSLYFAHPGRNEENIAAFIRQTEDILDLSNYFGERTEFCKTTRPFIMWIAPAKFWLKCPLRRSLFTILLRCGFEYREEEGNYEEAINSSDYIRETKLAVNRFLFGYTNFNKPLAFCKVGWRDFFKDQNQEAIMSNLGRPQAEKMQKTLLGLGAIWN